MHPHKHNNNTKVAIESPQPVSRLGHADRFASALCPLQDTALCWIWVFWADWGVQERGEGGEGVFLGSKSRHQRPLATKVSGCIPEGKARLLQAEEVRLCVSVGLRGGLAATSGRDITEGVKIHHQV